MKKLLLVCAMAFIGFGNLSAQRAQTVDVDVDDLGIFNHFGLGLGVGTTGISLEAAAPVTPYVAVRAGVNIFPSIKYDTDLDIEENVEYEYRQLIPSSLPNNIDVQGKLSLTTGHLLFDLFPSKASSFHVTLGAYFGGSKIINVYNKEDGILSPINVANRTLLEYGVANEQTHENMIGVELGDYFLTPDNQGNVEASVKVNGFRPYVGIGFGRPVPMKHRFTCNFDMGVQFWGSPKVYLKGANGEKQLTESDANGEDGGIIKTLSKISVWPVLNVRLVGRIL